MRIALRILTVVGVLFVLAIVALSFALPSIVERPEIRARIEAAAREATGRDLQYESLSAAVFPPSIELVKPVLTGEASGEPPLFTADLVALRLALLPLLTRTVVVDRLRVDGAQVRIVRSAPEKQAAAPPAGTADGAAAPPKPAAAGIRLGVRRMDVEDARVTLEDRSVTPPAVIVLDGIDARARADGALDPVQFEVKAHLASGGDIGMEGTATVSQDFDANVTLSKLETSAFAAYLGEARKLSGFLGGTVHATGTSGEPSALSAKLFLESAVVQVEELALRGKLAVTADLANADGKGLGGPFEVDATEAELAYGGAFRKPAGTAATTTGILKPYSGGALEVDDLHVKIKNLGATGSLTSGERSDVTLAAPAFDLLGWEELVPALADVKLGGRMAMDGLHASMPPMNATGAIVLTDVKIALAGQPPVLLRGRVEGAGNALRSRDLALVVAGQPIALDLTVAPLDASAVGVLAATGRGIDSAALLAAFSKSGAFVTGPLRFDARYQAPLVTKRPITDVVSGSVEYLLGPGRFKGVSVLRDTIERSGSVVQAAVAAGQAFGGRDVQRMYDDAFESIGGAVKVAGGFARFDPIRAVYRDYRVDLRGNVRLSDRALDASGQLVFADAKGAGAMRGQTLPISHIGGTLDKPRVELSPEDIAVVVARVSGSAVERNVGKLIQKLEDKTGGSPIDALQNLFRGRKD